MSDQLFKTRDFVETTESVYGGIKMIHPFLMVRSGEVLFPAWLEYFGAKPTTKQRAEEWEHRLLVSMAFGKPRAHQTLADWMNLETLNHFGAIARQANMIGVYEQAKQGCLPKGPGDVILHRCGHFYTVTADTEQAAYKFTLDVFNRYDLAAGYRQSGLDPQPMLEELIAGAAQ